MALKRLLYAISLLCLLALGCENPSVQRTWSARLDSAQAKWNTRFDSLAREQQAMTVLIDSLRDQNSMLLDSIDALKKGQSHKSGRQPREAFGDPIKWGDKPMK